MIRAVLRFALRFLSALGCVFGCQHDDWRREYDQESGRLMLVCLDCDRRVRALRDDPEHEQIRADWMRRARQPYVPVTKHRKPKAEDVTRAPVDFLRRKGGHP